MGKRKKKRKTNAYKGKTTQARGRKKDRNNWILAVIVGVLVAVGIYILMVSRSLSENSYF